MFKSHLCLMLLAACPAVSGQTYTVIHHFGSKTGDPVGAGAGRVAQSRGGALFTTAGDPNGGSMAFRIWPGGGVQALHHFGRNNLGYFNPVSGLAMGTDGRFYGTTQQGGTDSLGSIFKMKQDGGVTTLYDFEGGTDAAYPSPAPIQSIEGDFYGLAGPGNQYASAYRITKDGNFTLLHSFTGNAAGWEPMGELIQGTDGYFYGTMYAGGPKDHGTIFRISSTGDYKLLVAFNGSNGGGPTSAPIHASDGNFYGVTFNGGPEDSGTLYRMTPDGAITVLHNFTYTHGIEGAWPFGPIVQATDGFLYGVTTGGGKYGTGALFRANLAGDVTVLHNFIGSSGIGPGYLIQHTNGKIYGFTANGGKFGQGVAYSLDIGVSPFITYLPTYGRVGALVQILGQGFTLDSKVDFNGTAATSPVIVYPTYLRVEVPPGATTGPITVTSSTGTLTSNRVFVVH